MSLHSTIQKYADEASVFPPNNPNLALGGPNYSLGDDGEDESEITVKRETKRKSINRQALRDDLQKVKNDNSRYFLVSVLMVIFIFIASMVIVLTNLERPNVVTVVMTVFGVSTASIIGMMIKLWREKSNTEFLLALATNMDEAALTRIINILAKRLPK